MELYATCARGFERLLAEELASLGCSGVRPLGGQVAFSGTLEDAYAACLGSGLASRVVAVLGRIGARDADELYEGMSGIAWEAHVGPGSSFMVHAHGTNAELRNTRFVALRAKDAVADRIRARRGAAPATDVADPDVRIVVRLREDRASVGIDLSGEPLFVRGYEASRGGAHGDARRHAGASAAGGIRADYARALVAMAGIAPGHVGEGGETMPCALVGDAAGTLAAEAALLACGRAVGELRPRPACERWGMHDPAALAVARRRLEERAEAAAVTLAREAEAAGKADGGPVLDLVVDDVAAARRALDAAGLSGVASLRPASEGVGGCRVLVASLLAHADSPALQVAATARLATLARELQAPARVACLAAPGDAEGAMGTHAAASIATQVGRDAAELTRFEPSAPLPARPSVEVRTPTGARESVLVGVAASDQFAARLAKAFRLRSKWARREDVSCYRVYDADLPDYAVAIDVYGLEGAHARTAAVVAEYAPPREIDPALARARLADVLAIVPAALGCSAADVHLRVRERSRGGSQYSDAASARPEPERVSEGGLVFEVDLGRRLDTGIFLDDRETRAIIRELAKPQGGQARSFLNLFAYTGTATCYAADGGAGSTTTVDLSQRYLDWARRNMAANGFAGPEHEYVRADVLRWASEARHGRRRWDLVFCAPPTFSNSSGMGRRSFDVQRDHVQLLIDVSRLLAYGGLCVFESNLRGFEPDVAALAKAGIAVEDVTPRTIGEDFSRTPNAHRCLIVRRA